MPPGPSGCLMSVLARWRAASEDPEQGELTSHTWGDYRRRHVEHGWWITPPDWGLGVEVSRDLRPTPYVGEGGRVSFLVRLGPLCWGVSLIQAYIERPRVVA